MSKKLNKNLIIIAFLALLFASCGKEIFAPKTQEVTETGVYNPVSSNYTCAGHTLIKPEVDLLFIVDNSSSMNFFTEEIRQALSDTIQLLAYGKFDYRVVFAPLLAPTPDQKYVMSAEPIPGVDTSIGISDIGLESFFKTVPGSKELGFKRAIDLINNNRNIFRTGANTIVAIISNGDDSDVTYDIYGNPISSNFATRLLEFKKMTKSYCDLPTSECSSDRLNSSHLRFISVVAHSTTGGICQTGTIVGKRYRDMSKAIYQHTFDTQVSTYPDTYNLCTSDYVNLFKGVNESIKQVVITHKYDYWPISSSPNIDESKIKVKKFLGDSLIATIGQYPGDPNGWEYIGYRADQMTRYEPSCSVEFPCEQETGYFIRLYGEGTVSYPQCLVVETQAPPDYYGYVSIGQIPDMSSIVVTFNGSTIPQDSSNGWEYIGYKSDFNIRVDVEGNQLDQPPYKPAIKENGYFFKLNGTAIYSNSDTVKVYYKAATL